MPNKNISQYNLLSSPETGDFLLLWDTDAALTKKVYINNVIGLSGTPSSNIFENIWVLKTGFINKIIGGDYNTHRVSGSYATVLGGNLNIAHADWSIVVGGSNNGIPDIGSTASFIGGGTSNTIETGSHAFVGGGFNNIISGGDSVIVGGGQNRIDGSLNFIGGGRFNKLTKELGVIGGGEYNTGEFWSLIGCGSENQIIGNYDTILNGQQSSISGNYNAILAGRTHVVSGSQSVIIGGRGCGITGDYGIAWGRKSYVTKNGAAVLSDDRDITTKKDNGANTCTFVYENGVFISGGKLDAVNGFILGPTGTAPTQNQGGTIGEMAVKDTFAYVATGSNTWGEIKIHPIGGTPLPGNGITNSSAIVHGNGNSHTLKYANPGGDDTLGAVTFSTNSPILSLPAGNGTYLLDAIVGVQKGTLASDILLKMRDITNAVDVANSLKRLTLLGSLGDKNQYVLKNIFTAVGSEQIQLYAAYSGNDDGSNGPFLMSTGTSVSYVKLE